MPTKLTIKKFIERAKNIHNNKYNYSLVNYVNSKTKIKIICPIHGIFEQSPDKHLRGQGCSKCKFDKLKKIYSSTKNEFILKSNKIHNNKYNYSLIEYINSGTKVKIICPIHGVFEQPPKDHLRGNGCSFCGGTKKLGTEYFIKQSKKIHGDKYDYSLVKYKNNKTKIKIICPIHGIFEQIPQNHLNHNQGCPKCCGNNKKSNIDFIKESKETHGYKYDYSLIEYKNNRSKVKIVCPIHGVFEQNAFSHIKGSGCPICNESKGERKIRNFLLNNKIVFDSQKKFKNCINILKLPFDFYLIEYNICIEYDGIQHFMPNSKFGGETQYIKIKINDKIKNKYCKENNIYLLRISYKDDIIQKMNELLKKLNK
jgi:very-short-patch-repair endonuclease